MPEVKKRKKSKLKIIISIAVILIVLLVIAVFRIVGLDNIKSVYYGFKYDEQQIDRMREENSRRLEEKVKEHSYIVAREPTEEEMKALQSGEITDEQLSKIISKGLTLEQFRENGYKFSDEPEPEPEPQPESTTPSSEPVKEEPALQQNTGEQPLEEKPSEEKPSEQKPSEEEVKQAELDAECDMLVSQIVAKMYILRSSFTSSLSGLAGQAYADYKAGVSKAEVASKYIGQAAGLESQCDGSVAQLMAELEGILVRYGRSTELVDTIYETYNNEKQYAKAHYMGLYLNN